MKRYNVVPGLQEAAAKRFEEALRQGEVREQATLPTVAV